MSFKDAVDKRNVIFVVGTGVSIGATKGESVAGWVGLISHGIDHVSVLYGDSLNPRWSETVKGLLDTGCDSGDVSLLISAASQVSTKLQALGDQAFADWLASTVGKLRPVDKSVVTVLQQFGFPILTTNYDTILDRKEPVSWTDASALQSVIQGTSAATGHLHGVWSSPASVILSEADYARHAASPGIQALQQAIASVKTLVYVGYGSGLDDPNFSRLLEWHRELFAGTQTKHYRLCTDQEAANLMRVHASDNIEVQSYGNSHERLAEFLSACMPTHSKMALTDAGIVRDAIAESKVEFEEAMRTHAVVLFPMADGSDGRAPIVTPPLLPVPYAQYVKQRTERKTPILPSERLDADDVAQTPGITVIACEESGGLSTGLRWLTLRAAESSPGHAPVYLSFNMFASKQNPVKTALRRELRHIGLAMAIGDPTPPVVLAVDDAHAHGRAAEAALRELASLDVDQVFIGCRLGDEDEILHILKSAGAAPSVRYLGRFETREVTELLAAVAPGQVDALVTRVVDAFVRTNLPRTPMTVASIVYILMHGDSAISSSASQSSILEQYVSILLGRGNPLEDARQGIEAGGRESVLASFAELLVSVNSVVVPEERAIAHFAEHFKRVGWKESPTQLLQSFVRRGLLRRGPEGVEFQHNSFVFLFAAKRALTHPTFLDALLERPIYYSRIIQVYAGLARSNAHPLTRLLEQFESQMTSIGSDPGMPYTHIKQVSPPSDSDDLEMSTDEKSDGGELSTLDDPTKSDAAVKITPLDYPEPLLPLFVEDVDLPLLAELARILDLTSSVLRDADQIEDLDLKGRALRIVLEGWGNYVSAFSHSVSFRSLVETLASDLQEAGVLAEDLDLETVTDVLERMLPVAAAMSGIGFSLKSRTLLIPLEQEMLDPQFSKDELLVGSALLLDVIDEPGWIDKLRELYNRSPRLSVWWDFFRFDLEARYFDAKTADRERNAALEMLLDLEVERYRFDSNAEQKQYRDRSKQRLAKRRIMAGTAAALTKED